MMERYIIIILLGSFIGVVYFVFIGVILMVLGALIDADIINNDTVFNLIVLVSLLLGGADAHKYYTMEN